MSKPRVLVTARSFRKIPGEHHAVLEAAGLDVVESPLDRPLSESELIPLIRDVDAAIVGVDSITAEVIAAAPRLRVISRHGVGYDNVAVAAATKAGVVVTVAAGVNAVSVAELVVGLTLSLVRHIPTLNQTTRAGGWSRLLGYEIRGKTFGVVGLGRIGREVARRMGALEMRVIGYDIVADDGFAATHQVTRVSLEDLLSESDVVSLHVPLVPGAPPLIGRQELALMKPTAFLINAARGGIVDEAALYEALKNRRLAGAAIDTFAEEPPLANPLLTLDNVIVSPHIGGYTLEATLATGLVAAQHVVDVLNGVRPAEGVVNPEVFDRA